MPTFSSRRKRKRIGSKKKRNFGFQPRELTPGGVSTSKSLGLGFGVDTKITSGEQLLARANLSLNIWDKAALQGGMETKTVEAIKAAYLLAFKEIVTKSKNISSWLGVGDILLRKVSIQATTFSRSNLF